METINPDCINVEGLESSRAAEFIKLLPEKMFYRKNPTTNIEEPLLLREIKAKLIHSRLHIGPLEGVVVNSINLPEESKELKVYRDGSVSFELSGNMYQAYSDPFNL